MSRILDHRPNPDALLAQVQKEESRKDRGKLKVFFGAVAGVGKTYAMLEEGRKRAAEGLDVVVGYAEAHCRPETEALLQIRSSDRNQDLRFIDIAIRNDVSEA